MGLPDHVLKFIDSFPAIKMDASHVKEVDIKNFDSAVSAQNQVDNSNAWQTVLQEIVKHAATTLLDVGAGGLQNLMSPRGGAGGLGPWMMAGPVSGLMQS